MYNIEGCRALSGSRNIYLLLNRYSFFSVKLGYLLKALSGRVWAVWYSKSYRPSIRKAFLGQLRKKAGFFLSVCLLLCIILLHNLLFIPHGMFSIWGNFKNDLNNGFLRIRNEKGRIPLWNQWFYYTE